MDAHDTLLNAQRKRYICHEAGLQKRANLSSTGHMCATNSLRAVKNNPGQLQLDFSIFGDYDKMELRAAV
jgi:hypothetical protein